MSEQRRGPVGQPALQDTTTTTRSVGISVPVPPGSWRDAIDWWADPRTAYAAGLADGYEVGMAAAVVAYAAALAEALDPPYPRPTPDLGPPAGAAGRELVHRL